jgi:flagellar hook-basal body complex protein FliE
MAINGINSLGASLPLPASPQAGNISNSSTSNQSSSFGDMISGALQSLDNTQKGAEAEIARAVAGESPDLHKTIIALQTADLSFQFGLQVRNKFISAYEEIMRMQV